MYQIEQNLDDIATKTRPSSSYRSRYDYNKPKTGSQGEKINKLLTSLQNMRYKFIQALRQQLEDQDNTCIRNRQATSEEMDDIQVPTSMKRNASSQDRHQSSYKLIMYQPLPEIFIMNLSWTMQPSPSSISKILVSIPQQFSLRQLMNSG